MTTITKVHDSDSFIMFEVKLPATPDQTFVEAKVAAISAAKALVQTPKGFVRDSSVFHLGEKSHTVELHYKLEF